MTINKSDWIVRLAVGLAVVLGGAGRSHGQMLIDDFPDPNDDGWTHLDLLGPPPVGPGQYDLVQVGPDSYEYNLTSSGIVDPTTPESVISSWDGSSAPQFINGFLRARVRAETDATFAFLAMRANAEQLTIYEFGGSAASHNFTILAFDPVGGVRVLDTLDDPGLEFTTGEDWIFEAGTVGDQLSMKVWRLGDPEPDAPQLTGTDSSFASGGFAVGVTGSGSAPEPGVIGATFDDVFFTVPEPSTFALVAVGLFGTLCYRRRSAKQLGERIRWGVADPETWKNWD